MLRGVFCPLELLKERKQGFFNIKGFPRHRNVDYAIDSYTQVSSFAYIGVCLHISPSLLAHCFWYAINLKSAILVKKNFWMKKIFQGYTRSNSKKLRDIWELRKGWELQFLKQNPKLGKWGSFLCLLIR